MDKAQINAAVKKIKELRSAPDEPKQENTDNSKKREFQFQVSSTPEKVLLATGFAASLAILFDGKKKRKKNPKKAKPYYKRFLSFYSIVDSLLDSTAAHDLKNLTEQDIKDKKLQNMEIEDAIKFEL